MGIVAATTTGGERGAVVVRRLPAGATFCAECGRVIAVGQRKIAGEDDSLEFCSWGCAAAMVDQSDPEHPRVRDDYQPKFLHFCSEECACGWADQS